MDTATSWYNDVMDRYEDAEARLNEAHHIANEEYWTDRDALEAALCEQFIPKDILPELMTIRQTIKDLDGYAPSALFGACMKMMATIDGMVVNHVMEADDLPEFLDRLDGRAK